MGYVPEESKEEENEGWVCWKRLPLESFKSFYARGNDPGIFIRDLDDCHVIMGTIVVGVMISHTNEIC
ncbi:hypothetical protein CHS0354_041643 [Potamilus streckersoni]|uniref:Uncharacterized protein n=1 Tax=Potamilus streckersoni TaxID=2493646 RepID=A0AAE0SCI2_9BIVA|nr:hypothetical protein CHS0354_041643 [Potamilus streckersoni]